MGEAGCANDRVFFGLFAAFCVCMLVHGLKTGRKLLKYGWYQRTDNSVTFWFAAASWGLFAGVGIWAMIFRQ